MHFVKWSGIRRGLIIVEITTLVDIKNRRANHTDGTGGGGAQFETSESCGGTDHGPRLLYTLNTT